MSVTTVTEIDHLEYAQRRWEEDPTLSYRELYRELVRNGYGKSYETLHRALIKLDRPAVPMSDEVKTAIEALEKATALSAAADAKAAKLNKAKIDALLHAFSLGVYASALTKASGLTTSRIYQLRDNQS